MLILGIETSAKAVSAALMKDGELLARSSQRSGLTHSRTLLPMVMDMLKNTETPKETIDAVAVSVGPGSFTGIRIGVSTAKGLCWGLEKPAIGVSTLEAMAYLCDYLPEGSIICPTMDARRSQVYNALFTVRDGAIVRITPDRAISVDELVRELRSENGPICVLGDAWKLCCDALTAADVPHTVVPEHLRYQDAWGVCRAAEHTRPAGAEDLLPVYLRLSQAERERQERMN